MNKCYFVGYFVVGLVLSIIVLTLAAIWLSENWFLPHTKIVTNGLKYRVLQLNIFHFWQTIRDFYNLTDAEIYAEYRLNSWHGEHDTYRPIENHERVMSQLEQINRRHL
jgi:hypothetical protein